MLRQAIENLISFGAEGFLITPNDSKAIVPAIDRAHEAGMLVELRRGETIWTETSCRPRATPR